MNSDSRTSATVSIKRPYLAPPIPDPTDRDRGIQTIGLASRRRATARYPTPGCVSKYCGFRRCGLIFRQIR